MVIFYSWHPFGDFMYNIVFANVTVVKYLHDISLYTIYDFMLLIISLDSRAHVRMILIFLLFFSAPACQLLAAPEKKEIYKKNNLASSPAIDDDNYMEEILKELSECRVNKINVQTTDILEEMAIMKEHILMSEKKIESLASSVQKQETRIAENFQRLGDISTRGRWCGYQDHWTANLSIITYTSLTFSDTNMDISETPFDINTG